MAIREQGFGEGVSLAQKALNQSLRIGQKIEQSGAEIENYLDAENIQNQTVELRTQLKEINTAANGDISAFKNASEEALANLSKNSRNSKIQAKLEREFKIQQSSYLNQMELSNREQIKNTNLIKNAQFIQSNHEEMAKANLNGDVDYAKELHETNLEALKASYDNGDLTEAEYLLRVQKEEVNATQSRLQVSLQNNFEIVNQAIKDEQIKDINIIKEFTNETVKAIENPQDYKELWEQRGYNVVDGNVIDKVTGKEITVDQLQKMKQQAEINGKKMENSFLKKNEELINESNQNLLFVDNSLKNGKTFSNEQLTMLEERDAQILGEEVAYKKWENIKNLNMFLQNSSPIERETILNNPDFLKDNPRMKAQYKAYSDINAAAEIQDTMQYAVDNGLTNTPKLSLDQDIEVFKANLLLRGKDANNIGIDRGFDYQVMTNKEMADFSTRFDKLPSDMQYLYQEIMYNNLTNVQLNKLASTMYKDNPNSSFLRGIDLQNRHSSNPEEALRILGIKSQGASIMENVPDFYNKKHTEDFNEQLSFLTQGYYDGVTIQKRPNDFATVKEIYTAELANAGLDGSTEEVNMDILEKSINTYYSKTYEFEKNDITYKIQTPNAQTSPEDMQDIIDNLTPTQLTIFSQLPEGFDEQEIIEAIQEGDYRLRGIQIAQETDLVYELVQSDGRVLADKNGGSFKLTLSNLGGKTDFENQSKQKQELQEQVNFWNSFGDASEKSAEFRGDTFSVADEIGGLIQEGVKEFNFLKDKYETVGKALFEKSAEFLKPEMTKRREQAIKEKYSKFDNLLTELQSFENVKITSEEHLEAMKVKYDNVVRQLQEEEYKMRQAHANSKVGNFPFIDMLPKDVLEKYKLFKGE